MMSEDLTRWIGCDQCVVAQAMYQIKLVEGELYFCGHHYNASKQGLDRAAYEVVELQPLKEEQLVEAE
jgi:hypothetical protein